MTGSRIDRLTRFFDACVTPEERHLKELVDANGGLIAVTSNEAILRKLYEDKTLAPLLVRSADRRAAGPFDPEKELEDLREDLKVDTETTIRRNFQQFERMFAIQQRELEEEMRRSMHREGDRIILSITSGPHDRIIDPVSAPLFRATMMALTTGLRISTRFGRRWCADSHVPVHHTD